MVTFPALLLPVAVTTGAVFVTSSVLWTVLPHHRRDFGKLPEEERLMDLLRTAPVGMFTFPFAEGPGAMRDPAFLERVRAGPVGNVHLVRPESRASMSGNLVHHLVHTLLLYAAVAYLARLGLPSESSALEVLRFVGVAAFVGHAGQLAANSIFWGFTWSHTWKSMLDALVYATVAGATFAWLWPG